MIDNMLDLQKLVKDGFTDWKAEGEVNVHDKGDLLIFNYADKAEYENRWNFFERVSRGLIMNRKTGEIVARPFDKFFNWGADGRVTTSAIKFVTEKIDGSLGILYRQDGQYKISTRGSFDSEQAKWATKQLNDNKNIRMDCFPDNWTLLFEIVYPENKIVIDYHGAKDLYLLAIRDRFTGQYMGQQFVTMTANQYNFALPKVYYFQIPEHIVELMDKIDASQEGWVVEFMDGQRFKFKGRKYVELHRLISTLSYRTVLYALENDVFEDLLKVTPDEYKVFVNCWMEDILLDVNMKKREVKKAFDEAPKETRKEFALWVMTNHKELSQYLFAMLDNKPIEPIIYKHAFTGRKNTFVKDMSEEI